MEIAYTSCARFEVGIRYVKTLENGMNKRVTEKYVFTGDNFLSAYTEAVKYCDTFGLEDCAIVSMSIAPYIDIVHRVGDFDGDQCYKVKASMVVLDEKVLSEKRTNVCILVQADSIENARLVALEFFKGSMLDYTIEAITKTNIIDVIG